MSPALDLTEFPAFGGLWSANPQNKEEQPHMPINATLDPLDIKTLWETRWKSACKRRQYPFQDGHYLDFAPLFVSLIEQGVTSAHHPAYTSAFLTLAQGLADDAQEALASRSASAQAAAASLFLRAVALLRVARYPYRPTATTIAAAPRDAAETDDYHGSSTSTTACALKRRAHDLQMKYFRRATALQPGAPTDEVMIPLHAGPDTDNRHPHHGKGSKHHHRHHHDHETKRAQLAVSVRVPQQTLYTGAPCPAVLLVTADRTGETAASAAVLARGWAAVVVEAPHTPEEGEDGEGQLQLWTASVLDWMRAVSFFDMDRVVMAGPGDAVVRAAAAIAGSCGARLRGVVAYYPDDAHARVGDVFAAAEGAAPLPCPALVVRGAPISVAEAADGLWTPVAEDEEGGDGGGGGGDRGSVTLSAYSPRSRACVGQLATADESRAYGWMEDVMAGRTPQLPAPVTIPGLQAARGGDGRTGHARKVPEWFSRGLTPPESDIEMANAYGTSL